MKILYLYQHFVLPEKSGITRTFEFARRLVAMGHEIHLIASDEELNSRHSKPYIQIVNGIHIHLLPIPYHNSMGFFKRVMAFMKYICGAIRCGVHLDYDLVYASSPPLTTTLSGIFLARIKKIPLVLEVRDLWPDLPIAFGVLRDPFSIILSKAIERLAYHSSAHVIALSPGIKRAITARGVKSENISFIPNSSDIESFRLGKDRKPSLPKGIDKEDLIVLYTGTLGIANGVSYICSLAKETIHSHPHIKFVVIGDGKEKGLILDLAAQYQVLGNNLFLLDPVSKNEIPIFYRRASLILNTLINKKELWNASPNKFFDALAAGRPIAINFRGWLADLILENQIGLVLDPLDYKKAALQIVEALSLPLWVENRGRIALKLGASHFDRDLLAEQLNEILIKVGGGVGSNRDTSVGKKWGNRPLS